MLFVLVSKLAVDTGCSELPGFLTKGLGGIALLTPGIILCLRFGVICTGV